MKILTLAIAILLSYSCYAQKSKTELSLSSGATLGGTDMFNAAKIARNFKHVQVGLGIDMQINNNVVEYVVPHLFFNAVFPVKYGYFYAGAHTGITIENPYDDRSDAVVGGQAGVSVRIVKWLYFNTELSNRIIMGSHRSAYLHYPGDPGSETFNMDMTIPVTAGLKFRF